MLELIAKKLAEQLNVDESGITLETTFKEDLGADSLDLLELVMGIEEEYGVEIPAEELEGLSTVGLFLDYITKKGITL
ncbi:MAG: acyl carrier protein [Lachnospiraceae bacterium]|nr:acyl carrier protein [Lachnospiraceae bacterium]